MASLRKKKYKSGKSVWIIDYYDGRKHRSKTIGPVDKRTAEEALHNFEVTRAKQQFGINDIRKISLKSFKEEYLIYSEAMKSYGTFDKERRVLRRFIQFFGDVNLNDISRNNLQGYQMNRLKKVSPVTVNLEFRQLKTIFSWAILQEYLMVNSFMGIKPIKTAEPDLPKFLELNEIALIRKSFINDPMEKLVEFYLLTGARLSEALLLKWEDIDFKRKQLVFRGKGTKSKKHRIINFEHDQNLENLLLSIPKRNKNLLFGPKDSNIGFSTFWVSRSISCKLADIGLPFATCHTFRHTYISHLIMANVPIATVKEIVGHSSIQTTLRYAHLADHHKNEMAAKRPY